jgi:hypothetical protein
MIAAREQWVYAFVIGRYLCRWRAEPVDVLGSGPVYRMVAAQPGWPCFSRYRWWYSSAR